MITFKYPILLKLQVQTLKKNHRYLGRWENYTIKTTYSKDCCVNFLDFNRETNILSTPMHKLNKN